MRVHWWATVWAYALVAVDVFAFRLPWGLSVPVSLAAVVLLTFYLMRLVFRVQPGDPPRRISSIALERPAMERPRFGTVTRSNGDTVLVVFRPVEGEADVYVGLDAGSEVEVEMGDDDTLFVKGGIPPGVQIRMADAGGDRE